MFPKSYVGQDVSTENLEDNTERMSNTNRRILGILSEQITAPTESNQEDNVQSHNMVPQIKWQKQREKIKELEAKFKVFEERAARGDEAVKNKAQLGKLLDSDLKCMTCFELVKDPQVLQCGHSACYHCLRKWFADEQNRAENEGTGHGFSSVVNQQKSCPYCRVVIQLPPAPNYRLYNFLNTMTSHLPPVPWRV
ncbi:hypothetical protein Clacol_009351 [Clathrus columnatus]|uniref:RING-type domain-containing protein n=1 Tax=Clathrus columnatus TaxID=1419009 RepID=A0AAV5AK83_9AGAM|nr:hypothetical protein Clacol_009351 [Clathrus columnatus]